MIKKTIKRKKEKVDYDDAIPILAPGQHFPISITHEQLNYFLSLQKDNIDGAYEALTIFLMKLQQMYLGPPVTRKSIAERIGLEGERLEEVLEMLEFAFKIEE